RFFQTASVIEENLSVFKSVCNHVDIVTSLLDHLYAKGIKTMFDSEFDTYANILVIVQLNIFSLFLENVLNMNDFNIMYLMFIYYTTEMIVFEDSDLYAIITYLKIKPCFLLQMKKIFIQESVKQKFLWLIFIVVLPIFIFHSRNELFTSCKDFLSSFNIMSIWSEDSISAKTLAMKLQKDVIFINAYLEFGTSINLPFKSKILDSILRYELVQPEDEDKINLNTCTGSVYNHFYNGTWQKPVNDTYWIHNDNICAQATREDINNCKDSSIEAFESWSNLPINSRVTILSNLVHTLEHNGKYLLAKTMSKCIKLLNKTYKNTLTCQNERLEQTVIRAPRGIILLNHIDENKLFSFLTVSLFIGNCVIVLQSENSCNITPYCNMFSTAEIPPGVINLLFFKHIRLVNISNETSLYDQLINVTIPKNIILPLK
ncbi:hypothetical protein ALC60_10203, partial [Trachymyrmex zeteki]